MKRLWKLLNSRKFAVYLLLVLVSVLFASTLLPSEITFSPEQWYRLAEESPAKYWLAEHFSTPYLVRNPAFILLNLFLFLSTLACTITRITWWAKARKSEFEKDKAFSFQRETESAGEPEEVRERLGKELRHKGWEVRAEGDALAAQKGLALGFWGSVAFHVGLLACFLAAPVTEFSVFRGEMVVPEGVTLSFNEAVRGLAGQDASGLPDTAVTVHDLWGVHEKGVYKVDFGGRLDLGGWDVPFSVNNPVDYRGYQISLHEFGYSAGLVIRKEDETVFDYLLNLRNPVEGDYFNVPSERLDMFVLFFPDFVREGNRLSSKSREPENPVLLVKFLRAGKPLHKGLLLKPGEEEEFEGYTVGFTGFRNWVTLIVVKEWGLAVIAAGFLIGMPGLFVRFLSNERRIEFVFGKTPSGTSVALKGYSRYYPAFLEREVTHMAERLVRGG